MIYNICAILVAACVVAVPILLVLFIVKAVRRKQKKWTGLPIVFCVIGIILFSIVGGLCMTDEQKAEREQKRVESAVKETASPQEETQTPTEKPQETVTESETSVEVALSKAEQFAEDNAVSVGFAESLEAVLTGMKLTDKSRVGVFHYNLSDVYNWKQIDDWASGRRYSAWMAQEHVFYIYEKDDIVVGVRDSHGNVFYAEETQQ